MRPVFLASMFLVLLLGATLPVVAQNDDPQATISALQTHVAELSPASATPSPESLAVNLTAQERVYLSDVATLVKILRPAERRFEYFLANPPSPTDENYVLMVTFIANEFLVLRDVHLIAPSDRLAPFNQLWNDAIKQINKAAEAYSETTEKPTRSAFDAATVQYRAAQGAIDEALAELDRFGLTQTLEDLVNPPPSHGHYNLAGLIKLHDSDEDWILAICSGSGGYDDLEYNAQVVVRDASGGVIGTGNLELGETQSPTRCQFPFVVRELPETDVYSVSIGRREGPTYSFADLVSEGWQIGLEIGD